MWWISYVVWRWCAKTTKAATIHYRKFKIDWQKRQYLSKTNEWKCSEKIHQWMKSYRRRRRLQLWHPIHPHPTHTSFPFNILHIRMNLNYQFNSININSSFTSFQMAAKIDISGKRNTRMLCVCATCWKWKRISREMVYTRILVCAVLCWWASTPAMLLNGKKF